MSLIRGFTKKIFGDKSERDIRAVTPTVEKVKQEYENIVALTNDELRESSAELRRIVQDRIKDDLIKLEEMKEKAESDELSVDEKEKTYLVIDKLEKEIDEKLDNVLTEILPKAFAIVKDTARRLKENETVVVTASDYDKELAAKKDFVEIKGSDAIYKNSWTAGGTTITWDMLHYDVQLIGGVVLHEGKIAEMATGEGKTLVATLPVFLNALGGRGVHIVTVNDYLARRDAEWMGPIYQFHGLTVDCIDNHQPNSADRRKAYNADITFGTNNEFGFDYLRDNMAINPNDLVQRKHNYSIVDEVDSVLIDDARTPLIISGPTSQSDTQFFDALKPKVVSLVSAQRKLVTQILAEAKKTITAGKTEEGGLLLLRAHKGLPKNNPLPTVPPLNSPSKRQILLTRGRRNLS